MVAPLGLSPEYAHRPVAPFDLATLLAAAGFSGLASYGAWAARRRRRPFVALVILGSLALAVPTSNLFALPNMRADRFMYLPSLLFGVGLGSQE